MKKNNIYRISSNKYRPLNFEDVIGQKNITDTLKKAIKKKSLAQVFLFSGPRGVGKTTCARILSREVNKISYKEKNNNMFNIFEIDAASNNSVEDIRNLINEIRFPPQVGKYKIYIMDEIHMLSQAAFNSFLKTLEEPPSHIIFILSTTEKQKIIPTVLSRCQIYDFKKISVKDIKLYIKKIAKKEKIYIENEAAFIIAKASDGSLRDALSIFDKIISFNGNKITRKIVNDQLGILDYEYYFKFSNFFFEKKIENILLLFKKIIDNGLEEGNFVLGLGNHFINLFLSKYSNTISMLELDKEIKNIYISQSHKFSKYLLIKILKICNRLEIEYKNSNNPILSIEIALLEIVFLIKKNKKII